MPDTICVWPDPEVLHKLRVALRRLRSLWWAYEPLLDRKDSELRRSEFKSLAAGKTRDWDVLRDLLGTDLLMQHEFASLLKSVDGHRAYALPFSRKTIGNAGVEQILQRALAGARRQLESRTTSPALAGFAEERVQSAEKALNKRVSAQFNLNIVATLRCTTYASWGKSCDICWSFSRPSSTVAIGPRLNC